MAAGPYRPDEDDVLRDLIPKGVSQSEIGRQLDRTRGSVANRAAKLGIRSDRTDTAAATQAKVLDVKARRAAAALAELEILEHAQADVLATMRDHQPWTTVLRGELGVEFETTTSKIPARDQREAAAARSQAAGILTKLEVAADEHAEAKAFITQLGEALLATAPETP
ncbi:hypothetical protein ACFS27_03330 [Promicromonospora vindobonensis]|uniref:Homeodomain-like domain-containing protein n=1 Tax=Promicromonospora vindobonensis TaxID=195748 RepID=A0ABW5VLL8_9MICO